MKKIGKKTKLILLIILILIVLNFIIYATTSENDKYRNSKIVAIKIVTSENGQEQKVTYTIKIKDYNIVSSLKEIKFETKELAKNEYESWTIINEYKRTGIVAELKGKKIIFKMPKEQLKLDIDYKEKGNILVIAGKDKGKVRVNQNEIERALINQGYNIK